MVSDNNNRVPFWVESLETSELMNYIHTDYGRLLENELTELQCIKKITKKEKELIIAIKAYEYNNYCLEGNAWVCIKYYLENFPELFKIHDLLFFKEPVIKFFYIINSIAVEELEKILKYQKLGYEKNERTLPDGRKISIFVGFLKHPKSYTLEENPVRKAFTIAEDSGIRIGFHYYQGKEEMYGPYSIALIRSFPIMGDDYIGDCSSGSGGFREDLEAGFKSTWEANLARILNEQKVSWEYEKASDSYATEIGYYIPDFIVRRASSTHVIEVKGFWDYRSLKKVSTAISLAKDEKIIIIDFDFYSLLTEKYSEVIPNWEETKLYKRSYEVTVVGINIGGRLNTILNLKDKERLKLLREDNNKFDSNAIKVVTWDDKEVGYISREWASIFSFKMDSGFLYDVALKRKELDKKRIIISLTTMPASIDLLNNIGF